MKTNLKESFLHMFSPIFNDIPIYALILQKHRFIDINKYALKGLHYNNKEEFIGLSPLDISPKNQSKDKTSKQAYDEVMKTLDNTGFMEFDWVHFDKDKNERWFHIAINRISNEDDTALVTFHDITEAKNLQSRFDVIMNSFPGNVYVKNEDLKVVYVNNQKEHVWVKEDNKERYIKSGLNTKDFMDSKVSKKLEEVDKELIKNMGSKDFIVHFPETDKTKESWHRDVKFTYEGFDGKKYLAGMTLDVTEKELADRRVKQLINSLIETIQVISEHRDPYTSGHEKKVAKIAVKIARKMGLKESHVEELRISALLHDIGKINIPFEILNKPGRLTENELKLIKDHSITGANIMKSVSVDWPIEKTILYHHERWNGSGYPEALVGKEIPLEARIIAVADVFDAMSSHRPYRPKRSIQEAINELVNNKGILYDPEVVEAFLKTLEDE